MYGILPDKKSETADLSEDEGGEETSEDRIEEKADALSQGDWPWLSIDRRVRSIPDDQLTSYMTQLLHRMSEKFDTQG